MDIRRETSNEGKILLESLKHLEDNIARVGWFKHNNYEDGTPVASVAAQNEFGNPSKRIPARPFMRPTIISQQSQWRKIAEDKAKQVLHGVGTVDELMKTLGQVAAGDIKNKIASIWEPPLSPRTIQMRLNRKSNKKKVGNLTKPLIDQGIMFNSLIYEVSKE